MLVFETDGKSFVNKCYPTSCSSLGNVHCMYADFQGYRYPVSDFSSVGSCDADITYGEPCTIHQLLLQDESARTSPSSPSCSPECAADLCGSLFPSNSSARIGAACSHTAWYSFNAFFYGMILCCLVLAVPPVSEYLSLWCPQHPIACSSDRTKDLLKQEKVQGARL